jgi:hypothetical protein
MDINVGALETCLSKIQDINRQNVTRKHFRCSSNVEFWFFSSCQNIVCLILCVAIIGGSEFLRQICPRKGGVHFLVAIVKISQVNLFMMYNDLVINYQHEHFQVFCDVVRNTFITITQNWITNLNIDKKNLLFTWLVVTIQLTFLI